MFIRLLHHSSLGLCSARRLCFVQADVMVEGLTCPHGRVQYGCCVIVGTLSWPWMRVGHLRDTVSVRCVLCVHGYGVLPDVCGASDDWRTGL